MQKNELIEIRQAGNGILVTQYINGGRVPDKENIMVFQTMAELISWLPTHFTHRRCVILPDATTSVTLEHPT